MKLVSAPTPGSTQFEFEKTVISVMKVKYGALGINPTLNKYVNPHIQWLWEQYSS